MTEAIGVWAQKVLYFQKKKRKEQGINAQRANRTSQDSMGQSAPIVCETFDYTGSEILKVSKPVGGNKKLEGIFGLKME